MPPEPKAAAPLNGMSVDVEEWFQVGAFEKTIDKADWDRLDSRVEANTDAVLSLFADVKRAFDPAGVLNPGVKVPLPGQRAIGDVKYDPALPPLPPAARRALDRVAAGREYAAFRLDLLDAAE